MVEVFTIGGGEYIVNTFNAVAAWTGGGGYRALLRVVMILGLIYTLMSVAFTMNWRVWMNWFLGSTLIYSCLMVPTVSVKVTDRINPSLAPATIANVPLGLGVMASFTSQVGDWLTRTAETVFTMPSQLNYSTNGMVYGARLFDATRNFEIRDAEFATNLSAHFKNCVFGDIMLGQKSMTDLANAKDLWNAMGPGSVARSQPWTSRAGAAVTTDIITCNNAYNLLSEQWTPMIAAHTPLWSKQAYPKLSTAVASAKLREDVPIVNQAFTAASPNFEAVMRQNTAINAFMQARDGMAGGPGAASIDTFATTRADIQARNTYNSIAQQAMSWVPILNIVLTVVFYAMFPVIFPLFLMPQTGVGALKGYLTGFFYLASWGPLYVILHMICMTRATIAAKGVAEGGMTLGTYAGIGAVNAETATIAGFMLMSVPFLAAGLAKGAMSISGQATSILSPAQNAAEAAAAEQTTGNYSYGNTSFANSTSNMRQSDQWSNAPMFSSAATAGSSFRYDDGTTTSSYGNGQSVFDVTPGMSKLAVQPTMSSGYVAEMRQAASDAERASRSELEAAAAIRSATHTNRSSTGRSTTIGSGFETGQGGQTGTSFETFDRDTGSVSNGIENRSSTGQTLRSTDAKSRSAETLHQVQGGIEAGSPTRTRRAEPAQKADQGTGTAPAANQTTNAPRGRLDRILDAVPIPKVSGSVTWTGAQRDGLNHSADRTRTDDTNSSSSDAARNEHANGDSAGTSSGTYTKVGTYTRASTDRTSSVSEEDALAMAYSHEQRAQKLHELSQQLTRDASFAESHGLQMSENLSQEFSQWYTRMAAEKPGLNAPSLHQATFTQQERLTRDGMLATFLAQKKQEIYDQVAPSLHQPDLVQVAPPPVSSDADVIARHHPKGLASLPAAPTLPSGEQARERVRTGKAALQSEQDAQGVMRQGAVQAGSQVQSEVNKDLNRQFFTDPTRRE
ncbi:conjugal transfer protein TraG N-terminal domain-containing protein [Sphingomonas sp. BK580]|uniref:conjugal transfer protein TraG N-terminal domain-containing protein n=1 Tax=Sphingomonas sp. BK580 TaxID=2586972 RepID=UPI00161C5876|nr:conjugal transfer protein TraG N-terminal domain-containing protein [Sphingomonas sp. BK580]MBB3694931.1 conjugal transfer mating pair stabilization protein TraG [Sphingomonas sp. BK580]